MVSAPCHIIQPFPGTSGVQPISATDHDRRTLPDKASFSKSFVLAVRSGKYTLLGDDLTIPGLAWRSVLRSPAVHRCIAVHVADDASGRRESERLLVDCTPDIQQPFCDLDGVQRLYSHLSRYVQRVHEGVEHLSRMECAICLRLEVSTVFSKRRTADSTEYRI